MQTKPILILFLALASLMTGCAKSELQSPCPDFGRFCHKKPINSWDYGHQQGEMK